MGARARHPCLQPPTSAEQPQAKVRKNTGTEGGVPMSRNTQCLSVSPELMYCSSLISSSDWSRKSLLFLITFRHTLRMVEHGQSGSEFKAIQ